MDLSVLKDLVSGPQLHVEDTRVHLRKEIEEPYDNP